MTDALRIGLMKMLVMDGDVVFLREGMQVFSQTVMAREGRFSPSSTTNGR